jgi:hypothetical protein
LITRRRFHVGGVTLFATGLAAGSAFAQAQPQVAAAAAAKAKVVSKGGGTKPTYLPEPGSTDPVAHSVAENLFWNDQLAEHAAFFVMLMPGPELAAQRTQAEGFKATFTKQLEQSRKPLDKSNFAAFNRSTIEQTKKFVDFKHKMRDAQTAGKLKSLVWPTFFEHTAREAEHFTARLEKLSRGDVALGQQDTVQFWSAIMGEHADFVAHLLDPKEVELISKAVGASNGFRKLHGEPSGQKEAASRAVDEIIDFKVAAEKGIQTGQIKSIIHPTLADHVRREALKAADELARAT